MAIKQRKFWIKELKAQRQWMEAHGGDMRGYIARYGSRHDPNHYGDGGEAIYVADRTELLRLELKVKYAGNRRHA